ncbi:MAG: A/G-specific adenine glycosylase [Clostridia bacterium]|nr:A/G-specific adenine glycosylase [Clostridia bacterium]
MDREVLREAAARIETWFAENGRALPWREDSPDPYHVWISEIMLQQTRIEAVIPYYKRFLGRLPDVRALADVSEDELLKLWEGLGYYSRARNLKKAAQAVVKDFGGQLPGEASKLRTLPGIGEYTAGAIASIAFGEAEPAVDGNVLRVLARLLADGRDVLDPKTKKAMTERLREIYPKGERAGLLTQGIMELGEVLCLPNAQPLCGACPCADLCGAHASGRETDFPVRSAKKERRIEEKTVFLLACGSRYALRKRPAKGLLAGLWEFPSAEGHLSEQDAIAWASSRGLGPVSIEPLPASKHLFTHVEWRMKGYRIACKTQSSLFTWTTNSEIEKAYSIPTAYKAYKNNLQRVPSTSSGTL